MAETSKHAVWSYDFSVYDDSSLLDTPQRVSVKDASLTVHEGNLYRFTLANSTTDLRIDPFGAANSDIVTAQIWLFEADQTVTIRVGLVGADARVVTLLTGQKAFEMGSEVITRSSTVGWWGSNASGSAANVKLLIIGT